MFHERRERFLYTFLLIYFPTFFKSFSSWINTHYQFSFIDTLLIHSTKSWRHLIRYSLFEDILTDIKTPKTAYYFFWNAIKNMNLQIKSSFEKLLVHFFPFANFIALIIFFSCYQGELIFFWSIKLSSVILYFL